MKTCSKCRESKPLDEFNRDKAKTDGRCSRCRECSRKASREWNRDNSERAIERWKNLTPEQLARKRATNRAWEAANAERKRATNRAWDKANAERKRETTRAWYEANKERANDLCRAWKAANREAVYSSNRKRRQVIDRPLTPVRREDIWQRDHGTCQLCGEPIDRSVLWPAPASLTLDHVLPLAQGGTHEPNNVQLAHNLCNQRKGAALANPLSLLPSSPESPRLGRSTEPSVHESSSQREAG